jgi:hypothetical protein
MIHLVLLQIRAHDLEGGTRYRIPTLYNSRDSVFDGIVAAKGNGTEIVTLRTTRT